MSVASGYKQGRKKNPPEGGLVGHRETDARGWAACAQRPRRQEAPAAGLADQALAASKRRATSSQLTTL